MTLGAKVAVRMVESCSDRPLARSAGCMLGGRFAGLVGSMDGLRSGVDLVRVAASDKAH